MRGATREQDEQGGTEAGPGAIGRLSVRHPRLLHAVTAMGLAWGIVYLLWRVTSTYAGSNPFLFVPFLLAELLAFTNLCLLVYETWELRPRASKPLPDELPTVDVFVCTYNEPPSVLRATLTGCRALAEQYPRATVWVLDDGRRPEIAELAASMGAQYLTRPNNEHAKAGNINNALAHTNGELLFVLDADHVPVPHALDVLVGYFDDPKLALVQTPHAFYNLDSVQHFEGGLHDQSQFFHVVCPGKDHHGAAYWCGSAALLRRSALESVGGVRYETIAEDFHTTIALHTKGWATRFHDEELVRGLAPLDLAGYLLQRDRWARGNVRVLVTPESPLRARGLTMRQRLSHVSTLLSYATGWHRATMLCVLFASLATGALPLYARPWQLGLFWAPTVLLAGSIGMLLGRGWTSWPASTRQELLTTSTYLRAWKALFDRRAGRFLVTPKDGEILGGRRLLPYVREIAVAGIALGTVVCLRLLELAGVHLLPPLTTFAWCLLVALGVWETVWCAYAVRFVTKRRQRRSSYRFPVSFPARIGELAVDVVDLSPEGFGFLSDERVERGETIALDAVIADEAGTEHAVHLAGVVRSSYAVGERWRVGVEELYDETARRHVYELCFLGALRPARVEQPAVVA